MIKILRSVGFGIMVTASAAIAVMIGDDYVQARRDALSPNFIPPQSIGNGLLSYVDPITRCEYLRPTGSVGSIVPRMSSDGIRQQGCGFVRQESALDLLSRR